MNTAVRKTERKLIYAFVTIGLVTLLGLTLLLTAPLPAAAHTGVTLLSTCGAATIDGHVNSAEWTQAAKATVQMVQPSVTVPLTATLYVMNSHDYLYIGITINDDEFSPAGKYVPTGDGFRINFDNDHDGTPMALNDDVLMIHAGLPQFRDSYIFDPAYGSANYDQQAGGTENGPGAASRVGDFNHFELRHPLCSGETVDFCLDPASAHTVGFNLEYLDALSIEVPPVSYSYPESGPSGEADITIANCSNTDYSIHLPLITR